MIDSGSQKSSITSELAQKLNLPVINKVCLQLSSFGNESEAQEFNIVKAKIQLGGYTFVAKLIVHDSINTKVLNPEILQINQ